MPFVGIVSKKEQKLDEIVNKIFKNYKTDLKIIILNESNIENMKNIKFETIVILENMLDLKEKFPILQKILQDSKYLIINSDIKDNLELLGELSLTIITYGFNSKATITVSSTDFYEDNTMLCIQRNIKGFKGEVIELQDIKISKNGVVNDIYVSIALLAISLIYNINLHFM